MTVANRSARDNAAGYAHATVACKK